MPVFSKMETSMPTEPKAFRVALTADFYDEVGNLKFEQLGLDIFQKNPQISVTRFTQHHSEIRAEQIAGSQGVIVLTPRVARESLEECENLLAIGRFGVGYDSVDVEACTNANVLVMITTGAVDRPVAEATVGWMIMLTHHMLVKDRLVRDARWDDRARYMGRELRDRTLGVVGLGGIGRSLVNLLKGFGMNQPIAFDPFVSEAAMTSLGVRKVGLDDLLATADFVSVHCPLNNQTRALIGVDQIAKMKEDAYLINTARGGIVDEDALYDALSNRRIAGAALDCFQEEPLTTPHRLGDLDNVILAPHSIAWTNELFRDIGCTACQSMLDLSLGKRPTGIVNPELLERPAFLEKWKRLTGVESG